MNQIVIRITKIIIFDNLLLDFFFTSACSNSFNEHNRTYVYTLTVENTTKIRLKDSKSCFTILNKINHLAKKPEVGGRLLRFAMKVRVEIFLKVVVFSLSQHFQISDINDKTATQYNIVKRPNTTTLIVALVKIHLLLKIEEKERISNILLVFIISRGVNPAHKITNRRTFPCLMKQMITIGRSFCQDKRRKHFRKFIIFTISTNHRCMGTEAIFNIRERIKNIWKNIELSFASKSNAEEMRTAEAMD